MRNRALFSIFVLALSVGFLSAQESQRGPDGGTTYHVSGVEILPIPGKPFSAKSRTDWTRTLPDDSTVKVHLTAKLARDSQGRMYRELRSFMPGDSSEETRLKEILLYDPIALTKTTCTVATRHCVITSYRPMTSFKVAPAGPQGNGTRYVSREDLGSNTMEGLDVVGTRETLSINPGVVGNERPLVSTREVWYSSDLETNLSVTRIDPREGKQVVQLSEVSRSEPLASQFQVPSGYTVEDARGPSQTLR